MSRIGEAKQLLANPVLTEAFDLQKTALLNAAMKCAPTDDDGRYKLLIAAKVIDGVMAHLQAIIEIDEADARQRQADNVVHYYETQAKQRWNAAAIEPMRSE